MAKGKMPPAFLAAIERRNAKGKGSKGKHQHDGTCEKNCKK